MSNNDQLANDVNDTIGDAASTDAAVETASADVAETTGEVVEGATSGDAANE